MNHPTVPSAKLQSSSWIRFCLSVFIVFHLTVIVVLANGTSYLGRSLQHILTPYANFIGLNSTWNFFSPDPAHTMYFRYLVRFQDDNGNDLREAIEEFVPAAKDEFVLNSSKRRMLYAMRFMILDSRRMSGILGPWICRKYPGATSLHIEHIFEQIPSLDRAVLDTEEGAHRQIFDGRSTPNSFEFYCADKDAEVSL